jgi:AcrR family transcriptional regulator
MLHKLSCTTYNRRVPTPDDHRTPRGAATRDRIVLAAAGLLAGGGTTPTVGEIARAAGVYPNQITHHFGSKDRLVVDAAFRLFLRDTARMQMAGRRAASATSFRSVLARTAFLMPSTPLVVACLGLAATGDDATATRVRELTGLVLRQSERYLTHVLEARGWVSRDGVARDARTFWSAVFGGVLLAGSGVPGGPSDVDLASTISVTEI